jgi:hypothetical protein
VARPKASAAIDLDALEREGDPGLFTVTVGGVSYDMVDPQSMDFRELIEILAAGNDGDIVKAITGLLGEADVESFWENRIPAFKLNALLEGYMEHYGFDLGEASASSRSSSGTARRSKPTSRSAA